MVDGIPLEEQEESTIQIVNNSSFPMSIMFEGSNANDWKVVNTPNAMGSDMLCGPSKGCANPVVFLPHRNSFIVVKIPATGGPWRVIPMTHCDDAYKAVNCKVGGKNAPMRGMYSGTYYAQNNPVIPNLGPGAGWDKEWPNGGGYTICKKSPTGYCVDPPTAGSTFFEIIKDGTADFSCVDGYSFGAKFELTAGGDGGWPMGDPTTVTFNPEHCKYGIRNYSDNTSLGMIGCSNPVKDGNMKKQFNIAEWNTIGGKAKPSSMYLSQYGQTGYCNMADLANPQTSDWISGCKAPSREWCDYVHSGGSESVPAANPPSNVYQAYCVSHDDYLSSPQFRAPYKMKITLYDGIVGKSFSDAGCNWSFPDICDCNSGANNCPPCGSKIPGFPMTTKCSPRRPPGPPGPPSPPGPPGPPGPPSGWRPCSGNPNIPCCAPDDPKSLCPGGLGCGRCGAVTCECPSY